MEAAVCQSKHYPALFGTFLWGRADDDIAWIGESRQEVYRDNHTYICLFPASIDRAAQQDIYYLSGCTQTTVEGDPAQVCEGPHWVSVFFFSLEIQWSLQYENVMTFTIMITVSSACSAEVWFCASKDVQVVIILTPPASHNQIFNQSQNSDGRISTVSKPGDTTTWFFLLDHKIWDGIWHHDNINEAIIKFISTYYDEETGSQIELIFSASEWCYSALSQS